MASIKAIEGKSIHQITSGQVIVDLNSVVKELVENALDAGATSIDVRFKNNGLDSIEVQDNGSGISPEDYDTIALKHYTSKLTSYDDLTSLTTFGFRGEALSSLCALSRFHILTARSGEAPKGKKLEFEISGKLKSAAVAACQKGTTVAVEDLFHNLPVRRKELEKNIKREYSKVLGLLHAYACIITNVRLSVSNQMPTGKKVIAFSTKSNATTKENIANIFGAKTLPALLSLNLDLQLQPTTSQVLREFHGDNDEDSGKVKIVGHISKPVFGEGRQTPDRQMFFVNSRPCALPQISKAFNEVYKSFNVTQSPFICADLRMDTNAYDVNVSPDKRTILLHDQTALLESIKEALTRLFDSTDQTVPQSQLTAKKLPAFRPLQITRQASSTDNEVDGSPVPATKISGLRYGQSSPIREDRQAESSASSSSQAEDGNPLELMSKFVGRDLEERDEVELEKSREARRLANKAARAAEPTKDKQKLVNQLAREATVALETAPEDVVEGSADPPDMNLPSSVLPQIVQDFNARLASQQAKRAIPAVADLAVNDEPEIVRLTTTPRRPSTGVVQSAFDKMRPPRTPAETAIITIGSKVTNVDIGTPPSRKKRWVEVPGLRQTPGSQFARFAAPGTQMSTQVSTQAEEDTSLNEENENSLAEDEDTGLEETAMEQNSLNQAEEQSDGEVSDELAGAREVQEDDLFDTDYIDEEEKKRHEEEKVQELIRLAEEEVARPTQANVKRAANLLKTSTTRDSTVNLLQFLETNVQDIQRRLDQLNSSMDDFARQRQLNLSDQDLMGTSATDEEKLSLTINKSDFARMHIIGQFNLGFILATRAGTKPESGSSRGDDLFIIDQHASDEIYNFHRLSDTTTLAPQPLVHPHPLELTAVEEETILMHSDTLTKNGFTISFDESGDLPVGNRCSVLTLPTSRETTFTTRDLEELIALLTETTPAAGQIVRPSKVRKMLAMRACRSSIMVGKTLTKKGMRGILKHMGEIDKPWNCPHGRPTMRHLTGLADWNGWDESDGLADEEDETTVKTDWAAYATASRHSLGEQAGADSGKDDVDADDQANDIAVDVALDGAGNGDEPQVCSDTGFA